MVDREQLKQIVHASIRKTTRNETVGAYLGGGISSVVDNLLDGTQERIENAMETHDADRIQAYNHETSSWEPSLRAIFAQKELGDHTCGSDVPSAYCDEMEWATENVDPLDRDKLPGAPEDSYFDRSDYEPEYEPVATTELIIVAESCGEHITDDTIGRISNNSRALNVYAETGDLEKAITRSIYDGRIPDRIIDDVLPPSEWPDSASPSNVRTSSCSACHLSVIEVCTDEGLVWLGQNTGERVYGTDWMSNSDDFYAAGAPSRSIICGDCLDEVHDWTTYTDTRISGSSAPCRIRSNYGIVYDEGKYMEGFEQIRTLRQAEEILHDATIRRGNDFDIDPEAAVGPTGPYQLALIEAAKDPDFFDGIEASIIDIRHAHDNEVTGIIGQSDAEVVSAAKQKLEEYINNV